MDGNTKQRVNYRKSTELHDRTLSSPPLSLVLTLSAANHQQIIIV